jgi:hypothetical protein
VRQLILYRYKNKEKSIHLLSVCSIKTVAKNSRSSAVPGLRKPLFRAPPGLPVFLCDFYGTSGNAVKLQIYCAIITCCLASIVRSELKIETSTCEILRTLSMSLLLKMPLRDLLEKYPKEDNYQNDTQLTLTFF